MIPKPSTAHTRLSKFTSELRTRQAFTASLYSAYNYVEYSEAFEQLLHDLDEVLSRSNSDS